MSSRKRLIYTSLFLSVLIFSGQAVLAVKKKHPQEKLYFFDEYANRIFKMLGDNDLNQQTFRSALKGYLSLQEKKLLNNDVLTIVDYSKSCNQKRFFVIDLHQKKILFKSLVAHGRNSGSLFARDFSNKHLQ
jgi:hypothetical protein